jgi:hypothetical protein
MPWSLNLSYSFGYRGPSRYAHNGTITQTLGVNGSLSITKKWKLNGQTNLDIEAGEFAVTSFTLTRDLHCFNMSFHFVPFGYRKSYSFTLCASSSILKDLKINKQQSHYDSSSF